MSSAAVSGDTPSVPPLNRLSGQRGPVSWFLARRLLSPSAAISIVGVAAGSAVLVLALSILNGFESRVLQNLRRFKYELTLLPPVAAHGSADWRGARTRLERAGLTTQPYAERKLVIQNGSDFRLVTARIVPDIDTLMSQFDNEVYDRLPGALLESGRSGVVLGGLLASRLRLAPGDSVHLIAPLDISLANPSPPSRSAVVAGLYAFEILDFDDSYIFIDRETARQLIERLDALTGLVVGHPAGSELSWLTVSARRSPRDAKMIKGGPVSPRPDQPEPRVRGEGPDSEATEDVLTVFNELQSEGWTLSSWESEHLDLITAMKMEKLGSLVVLFLIVLVASFNATSTMVMTVMEKYREIGILRSLGASRLFIRGLFLRQGFIIGLMGVVIGVGLGVILGVSQMAFHYIPVPSGLAGGGSLPVVVKWTDIGIIFAGALSMAGLAAWYPAVRAAAIDPAKAVNYEK